MMQGRTMPLLTLGLLLALPWAFPNRVVVDAATEAQRRAVAEAVKAVPYRIGPWTGTDEEFAPAAMELLHINAILSRRYERIGVSDVNVLVVHCTDVRDMRGHWPPICYPATGWTPAPAARTAGETSLPVRSRTVAAREYEYRRAEAGGWESRIHVMSFFVLADGRLTADIHEVDRQSQRLALAVRGVAQIQIVTAAGMPREEAAAAATELLAGMDELFEALGVGDGEIEDG